MDYCRARVLGVLYEQKKLLEIYRRELEECPEGYMIRCRDHGKATPYHVFQQGKQTRRRAITQNKEMQRALSRKAYLKKYISVMEKNIVRLEKLLRNLQSMEPEEVVRQLPKAYSSMPNQYFFGSSTMGAGIEGETEKRIRSHREWGTMQYRQSSYMPEKRIMTTSRGLKVRTKSELLICERLHYYGLYFRYEQVIVIGSKEFSADFTFECMDGAPLYWEHAGMMGDPEYTEQHIRKLYAYHSAGIDPGNNLILTYDQDGSLNMEMIDSVIRYQIIPRL